MTVTPIQQRLFARATMVFLFIIVGLLVSASFYTYVQDRKVQSVSLGALRMASWNLARLSNEAGTLDRELALMAAGEGDVDALMLRYDILWSRYDYLLNSAESLPTRQHRDNRRRIIALFDELRSFEPEINRLVASANPDWSGFFESWERHRKAIQALLAENFVGQEANQLTTGMEASIGRLANLRLLTLGALAVVFIYLAFAITFIRRQSRVDALTGLPNNNYLRHIKSVSLSKEVVICEIRQFRLIVSEYGNETANEVVQSFARKLRRALADSDELIQIAPGEFLIFVSRRQEEDVEMLAKRLENITSFDWRFYETVLPISASIGIAPSGSSQPADWNLRYQEAQRALSMAQSERQNYYISSQDLEKRLREERLIHNGLVRFFNDEATTLALSLVYQPVVRGADRHSIAGAEVLLRCDDRRLGKVTPDKLVELCERHGLGQQLGQWIFRQVARETRQLYQDLGFRGKLSINLNRAMLGDSLVGDVQGLLINEGIPAGALCLEITEDNAVLNFDSLNRQIAELKKSGVQFSLDDFGTGHSSLEYVRQLKVDHLKVDRCFVEGIENSNDNLRFLGSIIAMANMAYMTPVIEGVENQAQWDLLPDKANVLVQGYFIARPMVFNDFMGFLMDPAAHYPTARQVETAVS